MLYDMFTQTADLSASKLGAYRIAYNRIAPALAHRRIDDLTVSDLQAVVDSTAHTHSTQRDIKQLLSHLYQIALRDDFVDKDRARYVTILPNEPVEKQIFTEAEIQKLWDDYNATSDVISASALIMLYTGMRPGEVKHLKVDNIHLEEHWMTGGIKTAKGKRRKIIIPDKIVPIIQHFINSRGFLAGTGEKFLQHQWPDKRSELGLNPALTLHCCRHTYLTRLTALNVSPAMLQELAGHEDYETTLNYTHLSVNDRYEVVNKL
jgi:integrase